MGVVTLLACGLVDRFGRRPLWLLSSVVMIAANAFIGHGLSLAHFGMAGAGGYLRLRIPHSLALGPLPWLMMSEIFPTRIRARAVAITTTFIWFVGFMASALFPVLAKLSNKTIGSIAGVLALRRGLRAGVRLRLDPAARDAGKNAGGDRRFLAAMTNVAQPSWLCRQFPLTLRFVAPHGGWHVLRRSEGRDFGARHALRSSGRATQSRQLVS